MLFGQTSKQVVRSLHHIASATVPLPIRTIYFGIHTVAPPYYILRLPNHIVR